MALFNQPPSLGDLRRQAQRVEDAEQFPSIDREEAIRQLIEMVREFRG